VTYNDLSDSTKFDAVLDRSDSRIKDALFETSERLPESEVPDNIVGGKGLPERNVDRPMFCSL
jgi:hypothetical protein